MNRRMFLASLVMPVLAGCSARAPVRSTPDRYVRRGLASWYGDAFDGKPTASGEPFDSNQFTTAHYDLPFDSRVRVRNRVPLEALNNDREVELRVNDRVPLEALNNGRILDVRPAGSAPGHCLRSHYETGACLWAPPTTWGQETRVDVAGVDALGPQGVALQAARQLEMVEDGVVPIEITVLAWGPSR